VLDGDLPQPLTSELADRVRTLLTTETPEARPVPEVRLGTIGREAAALGAAILPLRFNFSPSSGILMGH
jgi:hypothetical protein